MILLASHHENIAFGVNTLLNLVEKKQLVKVAKLYYDENLTQAEIAKLIGVSRPSISRMLSDAKDKGLVKIFIEDDSMDSGEVENALLERFHLEAVKVVGVPHGDENLILQATARESALFAARFISPGDCVGMAWGQTLHELAKSFPSLSLPDIRVVQLMGNIDSAIVRSYAMEIVNTISARLGTKNASTLPCPIVVDNVIISDTLKHDAKIRNTLDLIKNCNRVFVNLALPNEHSCLYQAGYLNEADIRFLHQTESVGNICCRFIDREGFMVYPQLDARTIGISLEDLKNVETVLACVADYRKANILHAALLGGYINVLMVDSITANLILSMDN